MLVHTLGWVAAAVGMLSALPQLTRLVRSRSSEGCSLLLWQLSAGGAIGWTSHGLLVGSLNVAVPNTVLGGFAVAIVVMICRDRGLRRLPVLGLSVLVGVLGVGVELTVGPLGFAVVAFGLGLVGVLAQLREIATGDALDGVSAPYLVVALGMQLLWGTWALLSGETATLLVACSVGVFCALNLSWFTLRHRGVVPPLGRARPEQLTLAA